MAHGKQARDAQGTTKANIAAMQDSLAAIGRNVQAMQAGLAAVGARDVSAAKDEVAAFTHVCDSRDGSLALYEDATGHLAAVDAAKLA